MDDSPRIRVVEATASPGARRRKDRYDAKRLATDDIEVVDLAFGHPQGVTRLQRMNLVPDLRCGAAGENIEDVVFVRVDMIEGAAAVGANSPT